MENILSSHQSDRCPAASDNFGNILFEIIFIAVRKQNTRLVISATAYICTNETRITRGRIPND